MRKIFFVLSTLFLVGEVGLAKPPLDSWDNLKELRPGQKVTVVDMQMKELKGEFVAVTDESISLRVNKSEQTVERAGVLRVSLRDTSKRTRNMLIGAAIGVGAALAITVPLEIQQSNEGNSLAAVMAGATAAAGGAGAGIGSIPGSRTIYRVKAGQSK
jgi:hypothetical protein